MDHCCLVERCYTSWTGAGQQGYCVSGPRRPNTGWSALLMTVLGRVCLRCSQTVVASSIPVVISVQQGPADWWLHFCLMTPSPYCFQASRHQVGRLFLFFHSCMALLWGSRPIWAVQLLFLLPVIITMTLSNCGSVDSTSLLLWLSPSYPTFTF